MKKPNSERRREWRTMGTVQIEFEASTMARSAVEAERIIHEVLNRLSIPKAVKASGRSRLMKDFEDYFIELGAANVGDGNLDTDIPEEHCRTLT